MAHVALWKENQVQDLVNLMKDKPVIGIVDVGGIPGPQIQKMRHNLRSKANLKVAKIKLLLIALEEMENKKEGIIELIKNLEGQMGIITTDMNPFKLFQLLEQSKTAAPVKGGETAPDDIEIKAGETSFKPGPIVGELQRVGIPAAIEQGKVVIKADKVLVKAGDTISRDTAQMLTRMEIYPVTVGLDLAAVFEDGAIFKKADLDIDPQQFIDQLASASTSGFNLAININYVNPVTITPLLQFAHGRALNLMYNANVISPVTITHMLQKGASQMINLASHLKDEALDDELKSKLGSAAKDKEATAAKKEKKTRKEDKKDKSQKPDEEKKVEKEEVSEEEAAAGLGALFD